MKDLIFVLDQGTTHHKIVVFDLSGLVVDAVSQHAPALVTHAQGLGFGPDDLARVSNDLIAQVLAKYPGRFLGFGFANQGESVLAWNRKTNMPLSQVISWQCQGAADFLKEKKSFYQSIQEKSGLIPNPYFSAAKLGKLFYGCTDVHQAATKGELALGTLDSWMIWQWTGGREFVTDPTTACRTQLFETFQGKWSTHLMDVFGLKSEYFAKVVPNAAFDIVCDKGPFVGSPLPLLASYCDQPASLIGHGGIDQSILKASFGTGVFVDLSIPSGVRAKNLLVSLLHAPKAGTVDAHYYLEGGVLSFASAMEWVEKNWALDRKVILNQLQRQSGCYVLPAFSGLGAPHFRPGFKTVMTQIGLETTPQDLAVSMVQSLIFRVVEIIQEMELSHALPNHLYVDGGFSQSAPLMQFLADALQRPVVIQDHPEITSVGVLRTVLAKLGNNTQVCAQAIQKIQHTIEPSNILPQTLYEAWQEKTLQLLGNA